MPPTLSPHEIALRLLCTVVAGAVVGFDRGEHGRAAGLRTHLLVCLAACLAMVQANMLMNLAGKPHDSFVTVDPYRLPLGILSGIGFIGGGAILRKGSAVIGVTTAATLWFVTVLGLCFGGGQIALGWAAFALGVSILEGVKAFEKKMPKKYQGTLIVVSAANSRVHGEIRPVVTGLGLRITAWGTAFDADTQQRKDTCVVCWEAPSHDGTTQPFVERFAGMEGVLNVEWKPEGTEGEK